MTKLGGACKPKILRALTLSLEKPQLSWLCHPELREGTVDKSIQGLQLLRAAQDDSLKEHRVFWFCRIPQARYGKAQGGFATSLMLK